jgi:hypothetical protein
MPDAKCNIMEERQEGKKRERVILSATSDKNAAL